MIVADTSVLIDHLRGRQEARDLFEVSRAAGQRITGSVLSKIETLAGVREGEEEKTKALLEEVEWIEVDEEIADAAGLMARQFRASHPGIEVVDFVIAATVEVFGAELWTRNRKHFPMFGDLDDPYGEAYV